jgi:hypothetical protein
MSIQFRFPNTVCPCLRLSSCSVGGNQKLRLDWISLTMKRNKWNERLDKLHTEEGEGVFLINIDSRRSVGRLNINFNLFQVQPPYQLTPKILKLSNGFVMAQILSFPFFEVNQFFSDSWVLVLSFIKKYWISILMDGMVPGRQFLSEHLFLLCRRRCRFRCCRWKKGFLIWT